MAYSSPTTRDPRVRIAKAYENTRRVGRRPQHTFNVVTKPFQLQPMMIAPVLPGESLKNMMLQSQVWSDPLAANMKNIGWWCEYYFFYVKMRDLAAWDTDGGLAYELAQMFTTNNSITGFQDADGNAWTYAYPGAVDFLLEATKRVVEEYFRDEGEAWNVATLDSVPLVKIRGKGSGDAFERLTLATDYEDRAVDVPATMSELDLAQMEWEAMRDAGVVDMDFQDWMKTYGAQVREDENSVNLHRPEFLAHAREFTYPTNTVEPSTGVPSVAVGWRIAQRLDKRMFFKEPGWIVGYNSVRPKVYLGNQQGYIAGAMQTRASWLPAVLNNQMDVSHLLFDDAAGPLKAVMDAGNVDYWLDLKDLFNYGDQFNNYATPASGNSGVPFMELPLADGTRRYAAATEIMALFSDTTNGRFRQDGVVSLGILGRQRQTQPGLTLGAD